MLTPRDWLRQVSLSELNCIAGIFLSPDSMILEKLAHGIEILHRHNIVLRVVEEHHIQIATRCPSMGESICAEKFLARGSVYFRKIMYICMWNPVCLEHY